MKKKKLIQMAKLSATPEMVTMAKADSPVPKKSYWHTEYVYKCGIYLRAVQEDSILQVALFTTDHLALNATEPLYTLFIDKDRDDFIGYDHLQNRWTSAMLFNLPLSNTIYNSGKFCYPEEEKCIQGYLGSQEDAFDAICTFQTKQRKRRILRKHKKLTDQWDVAMQSVPDLPQDWEHWVKKTALTQNFIFYEYSRKGAKQGFCTWCEKEVPIDHPRHNLEGTCSCCSQKIQYKAVKKAKIVATKDESAYLVQSCGEKFVVREFIVRMKVKMSAYQKPVYHWYERRRFLYDSRLEAEEYYFGIDRITDKLRWISGSMTAFWGAGWKMYVSTNSGQIYQGNLSDKSTSLLGKTGFQEYASQVSYVNPCVYFETLRHQPILEQIAKAGLSRLAREMVDSVSHPETVPANELGKMLQIDRFRLKRLREENGGTVYLSWLQFEKSQNHVIPDEVIAWMQEQEIEPSRLDFIRDRMSAVQVKHYLEHQMAESGETAKDLLMIWDDYLVMAKRLGIDVSDPIVYRARCLAKRHNELAKILGNKDTVTQAETYERKFPNLTHICAELEKYEYSGKQYKIIAPRRIEDILIEGQKLQHCIHTSERYLERMSRRESYILFLRRAEAEEEPYYTLEVEPNGTVRQKRTRFNRQLDDIQDAEGFLRKWQAQLQKKLLQEDFELAERSKDLRTRELEELRQKQVRVNGNFQGRLLADILSEDLLEVEIGGGQAA